MPNQQKNPIPINDNRLFLERRYKFCPRAYHQSTCMPQLQPLCSAVLVPMYYPGGMKVRVSPVQWSKPHSILVPTQDWNPGGRIQNHKGWPLHYHCTLIWFPAILLVKVGPLQISPLSRSWEPFSRMPVARGVRLVRSNPLQPGQTPISQDLKCFFWTCMHVTACEIRVFTLLI